MKAKRVSDIIIGKDQPRYNDLWLDTSKGEDKVEFKYKGKEVTKHFSEEYAGQTLGIDEEGNIIPVDTGRVAGYVLLSDGNGGITANTKVNISTDGDVNADRDVTAKNLNAGENVTAGTDVTAGGCVSAGGSVTVTKDVIANRDVKASGNMAAGGDVYVGDKNHSNAVHLWSPNGTEYKVYVDNSGNLIAGVV